MQILTLYLTTAVVFLALDIVMLKRVLFPLFSSNLGDWLLDDPRMGPADPDRGQDRLARSGDRQGLRTGVDRRRSDREGPRSSNLSQPQRHAGRPVSDGHWPQARRCQPGLFARHDRASGIRYAEPEG